MEIATKLVLLMVFGQAIGTTLDEDSLADKCYVPCKKTNNSCVSHTCYRSGVTTFCTITSLHSAQPDKHAVECRQPEDVHGMPEFCQRILDKSKRFTLQNINLDKTTASPDVTHSMGRSSQLDEQCVGIAVLVSVSIGSFGAGCFVMSLLLALCKCINPCKGKGDNARITSKQPSTNSVQEHRTGDHGITQQRSPSHISVDSGLSSTLISTSQQQHQNQRPETGTTLLEPWANRPSTANGSIFQFNSGIVLPARKRDNYPCYQAADLDGVYAPGSECSYRDYQSIQGSSVYAPSSEGGNSDYSCHPTHRVLILRENGEIYQPSSESSGNDYSSLKGARGNNYGLYYAASDGSYKDYTSLLDEQELAATYCDVEDVIVGASAATHGGDKQDNIKFRVSGFVIPKPKLSAFGKPALLLENVNEYEVLHGDTEAVISDDYTQPIDDISNTATTGRNASETSEKRVPLGGFEMGDLASLGPNLARKSVPHEYHVLETDSEKEEIL